MSAKRRIAYFASNAFHCRRVYTAVKTAPIVTEVDQVTVFFGALFYVIEN